MNSEFLTNCQSNVLTSQGARFEALTLFWRIWTRCWRKILGFVSFFPSGTYFYTKFWGRFYFFK